MRKLLTRSLLTVAAGAAAVGIAASSASAATWTVENGGAINATSNNTKLVVQDSSGTQTLTCTTSSADANIPDGTSNGQPVGTITNLQFNTCSLSGIIPFDVVTSGFPYTLSADSQTGTVVSGTVAGPITAKITSAVGCATTVTGTTVPASYDNSDFTLSVPGTGQDLVLSGTNVAGCQNLLHDGDHASFSGDFVNQTAPTTINQTG